MKMLGRGIYAWEVDACSGPTPWASFHYQYKDSKTGQDGCQSAEYKDNQTVVSNGCTGCTVGYACYILLIICLILDYYFPPSDRLNVKVSLW